MFTASDADWVADLQELAQLGLGAVDVRLFGYRAGGPEPRSDDPKHARLP